MVALVSIMMSDKKRASFRSKGKNSVAAEYDNMNRQFFLLFSRSLPDDKKRAYFRYKGKNSIAAEYDRILSRNISLFCGSLSPCRGSGEPGFGIRQDYGKEHHFDLKVKIDLQ